MDEQRLEKLLERATLDFGATWHAGLVLIGDRLGLYKALAEDGPLTSDELAKRTDTAERYVREWLRAQSAGGYVTYDPLRAHYRLTEEQALVLADDTSPVFFVGAFQAAVAGLRILPRAEEAFRTGEGIGWHEHDDELFLGTERVFRPGYEHNLVQAWIPALDGIKDRLEEGGRVADVGCGHGASTIIMARAFPQTTFVGVDAHEKSIETARQRAEEAGVEDRVRFEVATAATFDGGDYDLVANFDCFHDMGDPVGAAAHIREQLAPGGAWMIVEPYAGERPEENHTPVGRAFYAASTLVCTPCSLEQEVGAALGAQAPDSSLRQVVKSGGFTKFRRAAETPFNRVFEARA